MPSNLATSKRSIMAEKLLAAIYHCESWQTDFQPSNAILWKQILQAHTPISKNDREMDSEKSLKESTHEAWIVPQ